MLIKTAHDRSRDIDALTALLSHPAASPRARQDIDLEIRKIRAGARGEAEAAYEIDFDHGASTNWAVLHDLRLEHQGRVAQIDHLLINRCLDIWVCESKHFQQGVAINDHGEFTTFYGNRSVGIPSPLEQNRKHLEVLRAVLASSLVQLPTRLGLAIRPALHSVVLVSKGARITRPKKAVPGVDSVVKSDQLRELIDRRAEGSSAFGALVSAAKLVAPDTLDTFARQLAGLHRPMSFDWAAKFGIAQAAQRASVAPAPARPSDCAPSVAGPVSPGTAPAPADAPPRWTRADPDAAGAGAPAAPAPAPKPVPAPISVPAPVPAAVPSVARQQLRTPATPASGRSMPSRDSAPVPAALPVDSKTDGAEPADDGIDRLSTSKLGAKLGARNAAEMIDRLSQAGYLLRTDAGPVLTDKAKACGAVFVEKSRYGPYFLWPADLKP